ncbi:NUDIX hydrolase [Nitratireductor luteus]|uniref:NUDIX hydrolase n=1 Tax=Nitratireductor luteus TaxID=2976980 RepID=UPI00224006BA|nr:NUDIX hydrolase [Nitratireductor luteus]
MLFSHIRRIGIAESLRRIFGGNPPRVQAAALPWRHGSDGIEVMLITSRDTGRWVLPKGWPEAGETLAESALREAGEEAGIEGNVDADAFGHYFYSKVLSSGMQWHCQVEVYPVRVSKELKKWPEMKERERRWVSPRKAAEMVQEPDLAELIAGFTSNPREIVA